MGYQLSWLNGATSSGGAHAIAKIERQLGQQNVVNRADGYLGTTSDRTDIPEVLVLQYGHTGRISSSLPWVELILPPLRQQRPRSRFSVTILV